MDEIYVNVRPFFVRCAIIEAVTVGLLVITVLLITIFSKSYKQKIRDYYKKYVLEGTSISEVIPEDDNNEI